MLSTAPPNTMRWWRYRQPPVIGIEREQRSSAMSGLTYSEKEAQTAPQGHVRFPNTDLDVVAYRINATDLCLLVNKGGQCIYRATLIGALDPTLKPHMSPLINDTFPIRDLPAALAEIEKRMGKM
jgi:hypothetical protein